jgi:hypothetical protein
MGANLCGACFGHLKHDSTPFGSIQYILQELGFNVVLFASYIK